MLRPIEIPPTTPESYVSFNRALNLRLPEEDTGDWHPITAFFCHSEEYPRKRASLAGVGCPVDTTPSLGTKGVRDMSEILERQEIMDNSGPVWFANHFRAIADLAMLYLPTGLIAKAVSVQTINQWLDTEVQIQTLTSEYLSPLRDQINEAETDDFDRWLPTIVHT